MNLRFQDVPKYTDNDPMIRGKNEVNLLKESWIHALCFKDPREILQCGGASSTTHH